MGRTLLRATTFVALFAVLDAYPRSGKVYELGNPNVVLFEYNEVWTNLPEGRRLITRFTEPDGTLAVTEDLLFLHGRVRQYTIDQRQMGYINTLEVGENKAHYTRRDTRTGKGEDADGDWGENYVVIPELLSFAVKHWDEIVQGDTVNFRLAILEKMDTYGFKMFKDSELEVGGRKAFVFEIKPSSIFIAAVLAPSYLTVDAKEKFPIRFHGPAVPKLKAGPNNQRALEADLVYLN